MTNRMLYEANKFLQEAIKEKIKATKKKQTNQFKDKEVPADDETSINENKDFYESLCYFAEKKDTKNLDRPKKEFPEPKTFIKSINRLTNLPKKEDKRAWSLQITENSLLLIKALAELDISPKDIVAAVEKYDIDEEYKETPDESFSAILYENRKVLIDIEEIKNMLVTKPNNERHSLLDRLKFFKTMHEDIYLLSDLNNNYFTNSSFQYYGTLLTYCQKMNFYIVKKNSSVKIKKSVESLISQIYKFYLFHQKYQEYQKYKNQIIDYIIKKFNNNPNNYNIFITILNENGIQVEFAPHNCFYYKKLLFVMNIENLLYSAMEFEKRCFIEKIVGICKEAKYLNAFNLIIRKHYLGPIPTNLNIETLHNFLYRFDIKTLGCITEDLLNVAFIYKPLPNFSGYTQNPTIEIQQPHTKKIEILPCSSNEECLFIINLEKELEKMSEGFEYFGLFADLNMYFSYELILYIVYVLEKYESLITQKSGQVIFKKSIFENKQKNTSIDFEPIKLNILDNIKKFQKDFEELLILFAKIKMENLTENKLRNISSLTSGLREEIYRSIYNIIFHIYKTDNKSNTLVIPKMTEANNTLSYPIFLNNYNPLFSELEKLKGGANFDKWSNLQNEAFIFINKAWKNGITPILATGMGSGKTRVACKEIKTVMEGNSGTFRYFLIVTPANVINEWEKEMQNCNMDFPIVLQANDDRNNTFKNGFMEKTVYITSYDCLENDIKYYIENPPLFIIYDELHEINNSSNIQPKFLEFAKLNTKKEIRYKLAITGTPAQNSENDFYMNYCFFNEQKRFLPILNKNIKGEYFLGNAAYRAEIKEKMVEKQMYFFGNSDKEEFEFNINYYITPIEMNKEHAQSIEILKEMKIPDSTIRQYAISPNSFSFGDSKINNFIDSSKNIFIWGIINGIPSNEKIIVFSQYLEPLYHLSRLFGEKCVLEIGDGGNDNNSYIVEPKKIGEKCSKNIDDFYKDNATGGRQILLTSIKKSSTGRNLENANNLILIEAWWNPMVILQSLHRIIRKTQKKDVNIFMPIYFEKNEKKLYEPFSMEKDIWNSMIRKVDSYNKFLNELIELAKEINPKEIENLKLGQKKLPVDCVVNDIIIFNQDFIEMCKNNPSYLINRIKNNKNSRLDLKEIFGKGIWHENNTEYNNPKIRSPKIQVTYVSNEKTKNDFDNPQNRTYNILGVDDPEKPITTSQPNPSPLNLSNIDE